MHIYFYIYTHTSMSEFMQVRMMQVLHLLGVAGFCPVSVGIIKIYAQVILQTRFRCRGSRGSNGTHVALNERGRTSAETHSAE